ncbi:leucine efflux protein LeuE [Microtetraspora sp. NBRC 16547]|uniref:leucine efflux protein LeuE n=1 Tax=Microtetraspora sp. NBRC 16547 TaxID=3030993 RepID=UPI0024A46FE6|nr:leucine efflux protein LeuE [Microtetraspora sp. NBRC 16547]GLX02807.1 leucine efflux protein [Microtetraspora sp. NBRC 16547]
MFFGITDIWTYAIGAFLIILLPGPNSLYVLSTAAQRGVREGYRAASGVFIGDTVLMVLSAAGVASLLKSNPMLFNVVKYAGAAYLAWIGFGMLRAAWASWRSRGLTETVAASQEPPVTGDPFRKALVISLLNPKAILFFVSFFIQFVDTSYSTPAISFLILGTIVQFFSALYLSMLIFSGTFVSAQFRRRRKLSAGLTSGVGALFLGFGAKLATTSLG